MNNNLISVIDSEEENDDIWNINCDGFFKKNVEQQMLKDDMPQESIDSIFFNASRILNQCPKPNSQKEMSKTGIVIGKVQSGKTSNFISTLALAFDNGYEIAIVLGGNKLPLLKQNADRIEETFNTDKDKLVVLKTNDNKTLINSDRIMEFIENERKVIIVGLKHYRHISLITEIFDNDALAEKPVLIIDDEGDQATLNTKAYLKSMSSTYDSVIKLKNKLKRHCFLSVTATPQANILIETIDKLSPDFGELVYPGEGYCGLQEFHGGNNNPHIYEIPNTEPDLLDDNGVPESVYNAMAMFFVGNAIRYSRGDKGKHAMLVHPSRKKFDHDVVVKKLDAILDDWKEKSKTKLSGKNDLSYVSLQKYLIKAYDSFVDSGVICAPFQELELTILNIITKCSQVLECNSSTNASANSEFYETNIFVGGDLVERGITIKGLAVTYITRRAKGKSNVDNTEQRARWFGYKEKYFDVCCVFTTKDIKDDFLSILENDEDMWSSIERAREKGVPFKEMPRIFTLSRNAFLRLTRSSVARTKNGNEFFSEWKSQKYLIKDCEMAEYNLEVISKYREENQKLITTRKYSKTQTHAILEKQSFSDVYEGMLSRLAYRSTELLNKSYFSLLNEALQKVNEESLVDIYWIRDEVGSTREIKPDDSISQLFQGRNPNFSSPNYYVGDRSLVNDEPDHIQIQIHRVKPTNIPDFDFYSPVLAIYIPTEKLSNVVVRE